MKSLFHTPDHVPNGLKITAFAVLLTLSQLHTTCLSAQPTTQSPPQVTLEGTLPMYMVTLYGDSLQEIDHYRKPHKEGECIAFVLKTDKPMDMTQYLSQEEIDFLSDNGTIWQSEFMVVPRWDLPESISEKDFASQYANKRVRVTGSLLCPMAGWMNVTLVRMDFTKVELVE